MATAKPMKPIEYDGKSRDARTVDAWLIRMTTYLTLTNTADERKVELASSYLAGDAFDWFIDNQTTLVAGTFDDFKTSLRDRFVPQNYKSVTYNQYKGFKQGSLSVSEYSIKFKALADQIPDLVPFATRDLEFVAGLYHEIKKFIVSQPPVAKETWTELVGRALRIEETLLPGYNRPPPAAHGFNRSASTAPGINGPTPTAPSSRRNPSPNQPFRSNRPDYWKQNSAAATTQPPKLEPLSESDRTFLIKHKGCFRCRQTYADHTRNDCPLGKDDAVKNKGFAKEVKQEANFISEAEEYQFEESEECQVVPPIVLPIQLDDNVHAEGLVDSGSTSDFISKKLINRNPSSLRPRPSLSPSLLHNALSHKSVRISEELSTRLQLPSVRTTIKSPTILKVAPLASHNVILGMPFLMQNDLLIDPVARTVVP
jgi:retrotransposon gag protein